MSNDLNLCSFIGRLGKPPEVRYSADGKAITSFSIAVGNSWKDKAGAKQESTEWVNISTFGKLAEIAGEYLVKGSQVYVSGKMKTDKYTDKAGVEKYSTKIIADNIQMLGGKKENAQAGAPQVAKAEFKAPAGDPFGDFGDDLPFAKHGMNGAGVSWRAM